MCLEHETLTHPTLRNIATDSKYKLQMYNRDGTKR